MAWFSEVYSPPELRAFIERDFSPVVLRAQLASPQLHTFLLLEVRGQAVGFARINWARPVPLTNNTGAELQKIYFLPAFTGQGLGRLLMEAVFETVWQRGERVLWLDVLKSNPRARALYERLGFEYLGEKPFRTALGEIGLDVLIHRWRRQR